MRRASLVELIRSIVLHEILKAQHRDRGGNEIRMPGATMYEPKSLDRFVRETIVDEFAAERRRRGGRSARQIAAGAAPSRYCSAHQPIGTLLPCHACAAARERFEGYERLAEVPILSLAGKGGAQGANVAPLPPFPMTPEEVDHSLRGSASTSSGARIEIRGRIVRGMRGTFIVDSAGVARSATVVIVEVPR
jgi:hypothetical protein